ncbi:MAG: hypothetical protein R3175_16605 [Marinobacter sp.]|nr:hypothetical protein [Marinobacter sp.]
MLLFGWPNAHHFASVPIGPRSLFRNGSSELVVESDEYLITPVFALYLRFWLNGESLTVAMLQGSGLILLGLGLFFFGARLKPLRKVAAS